MSCGQSSMCKAFVVATGEASGMCTFISCWKQECILLGVEEIVNANVPRSFEPAAQATSAALP